MEKKALNFLDIPDLITMSAHSWADPRADPKVHSSAAQCRSLSLPETDIVRLESKYRNSSRKSPYNTYKHRWSNRTPRGSNSPPDTDSLCVPVCRCPAPNTPEFGHSLNIRGSLVRPPSTAWDPHQRGSVASSSLVQTTRALASHHRLGPQSTYCHTHSHRSDPHPTHFHLLQAGIACSGSQDSHWTPLRIGASTRSAHVPSTPPHFPWGSLCVRTLCP